MHTAPEIIALARQAHVPFGAHAFIVVQENGGFFAEASYLVNPQMTAEQARADAESYAAYRKARQPSWDFHVMEVGAPVNGAELIERLAGLIEEAIENHIYDTANGDVVPDDCGYHAAVQDAAAFIASQRPFELPPIGALEVIRDLEGSLSELDQQIDQMKGMFPGDETIDEAQEEAAEALQRAKMYREGAAQSICVGVSLEGGLVSGAWMSPSIPGLTVTVVDYDIEGTTDAVAAVQWPGEASNQAVVTVYDADDLGITAPTITYPEPSE